MMSLAFWVVAVFMLIVALGFSLWPVIRYHNYKLFDFRNRMNIYIQRENLKELEENYSKGFITRDEYDNAMQEIQYELAHDIVENKENETASNSRPVKTLISILILFPAAITGIYLLLGDVSMITHTPPPQQASQQTMPNSAHSVEDMVTNLRTRLEQQPEDGEGWRMLGRSYLVMDRHQDAVSAYRNARKYLGDDPAMLADYSEALILANNNQFTEEVEELIRLSLQANPNEQKALWIAGYGNYELGNLGKTLEFWERLLAQLQPGSDEYASLNENIDQIRLHMEVADSNSEFIAEENTPAEDTSIQDAELPITSLNVQVSIEESLLEKTRPEDVVFVFARAKDGPRMPLAIVRKTVRDLPVDLTLDDSMAMSPGMNLSAFEEIVIVARISRSGQATPASGDLSGSSNTINLDETSNVNIVINEVIP